LLRRHFHVIAAHLKPHARQVKVPSGHSAPRADPCGPVWFSAEYVYRREVGEAIYGRTHCADFYRP
jgi:hypothetical protein